MTFPDPPNGQLPSQFLLVTRGDIVEWLYGQVRLLIEEGIERGMLANGFVYHYQPEPFDGTLVIFPGDFWAAILAKQLLPSLRKKEIPFLIFSNVDHSFVTSTWPEDIEGETEKEAQLPPIGDLAEMIQLYRLKTQPTDAQANRSALEDELLRQPSPEELAAAKDMLDHEEMD